MTSNVPVSSSEDSPDAATASAQSQSIQKSFSCVLCAQRKVKCDKAPGGCSNCTKARVSCVYKAPLPARRRKKGIRDIDVHTRLRLYEDALRNLGIDPTELENNELSKLQVRKGVVKTGKGLEHVLLEDDVRSRHGKPRVDAGVLVSGEGRSRYLENGLWTSLQGEFRDSKELLDDDTDEEVFEHMNAITPEPFIFDGAGMLFGTPKAAADLRPLHPQPVQIFKLWQTYIDNINPLVKLFHTPTIQQVVLNASGNLDDLPKNVEALLFAIYAIALSSVGDAECDAIMGESKAVVAQRFRSGAQHALYNASFLKTSDLMVLQALVLFLLSLQNYDGRVMWILTGIAARIGQRIGLHRDGEILRLPPFETEIRRRLWWQIMFLDGFAEKLAGTGGNVMMGDTKPPLNLNDSDLFPGMKELPKEHEGATEMMFFLLRTHVGTFLKRTMNAESNFDGVWNKLTTSALSVPAKDKAIDELEALFQRKFLQYCDKSIPWHFMCTFIAKAIIFMMRFMAHNPEQYGANSVAHVPQSEKDMLFNVALQVTSIQNLAYTNKEMQGFIWHVNLHFQWKSFIYLVGELRYRTEAPEADEAWKQVKLVYDFHPNFAREVSRRALPIAVGNLTLKAWDAFREARDLPEEGEPYFIQVLRAQRITRESKRISSQQTQPSEHAQASSTVATSPGQNLLEDASPGATDPFASFQWDASLALNLDADPLMSMPQLDPEHMDWSGWNNLLKDFTAAGVNGGTTADVPDFGFGVQ